MSAFLAVLRFDDKAIEPELPRRLSRLIAYRGPNDSGERRLPGCMLTHHLMRISRSCAREKQPLLSDDGQVAVVCDARLDQRDELIRSMRHSGRPLARDLPTSRLLLESYLLWGEEFLERIAGDFSVVVVDRRRSRLLAARDPFGLRSLYYGRFDGGLILSNDPLPLMAHPEVDLRLDEVALADFLMFGRITALDPAQTPFTAIRQLAAGHRLRVDLNSGQRDIRRFWNFPMVSRPLRYGKLEEYGEHFRAVLKMAVSDRIDATDVVAPMSGGLDSTTAVAIAAELMAEGRGPDRLTAMTTILDEADPEGRGASEVARFLGVNHRLIKVEPGKPLESWRPEPFPRGNFFNFHERNQELAAQIAPVSMNASGADYALAPEPFTVLGQFSAAGVRDTWRALKVVKQQYGYRPPLGSGLHSRLRGVSRLNPLTQPVYDYPSWINRDFERRCDLRARWDAFWERRPADEHPLRPTAHKFIASKDTLSMHLLGWPMPFAPPTPTDPFTDQRVIEFLWSLPPLPWFYKKHILRSAMRGRLPESVLWRPKASAGKWVPPRGDWSSGFSWCPGPVLSEMLDESRLPQLDGDSVQTADFHPMFLQKWLESIGPRLTAVTGRSAQVTV